jgi:hypothetical protein
MPAKKGLTAEVSNRCITQTAFYFNCEQDERVNECSSSLGSFVQERFSVNLGGTTDKQRLWSRNPLLKGAE